MALIITEGPQPSEDDRGYLLTSGVHTDQHVRGWRAVTDAVYANRGRVVIQLMHVGRVAHPDNTPHWRRPVLGNCAGYVPIVGFEGMTSAQWRAVIDINLTGTFQDLVGSVFFLASDDAAVVTGQNLNFDGGVYMH